jgi:hypothetical protein
LLVTTVGRTGSNWLLTLLSRHPEVVAYQPFLYETRVTGYWMNVLRTVAEPTSYMQSLRALPYEGHWWIGDRRPEPVPLRVPETEIPQWLGGESVEASARVCQERIDAFYCQVAEVERRRAPRFFAEKAFPGFTAGLIRELYPGARELVLVRDLRDVVCSIVDYNAKRGLAMWGFGGADGDEGGFALLRTQASRMLRRWRAGAALVRYEDLIAQPESTLAAAFSSAGLDAREETVARVIDEAARVAPRAQAAHQTSATVGQSVGRWRRDLSPERQRRCAEVLDAILVEFGYPPTATD